MERDSIPMKQKASSSILSDRREIWQSKEILRNLYHRWYRLIGEALKPGVVLELGGGSGNLKEFLPGAISSDILFAPWLDAVLDAQRLPFRTESIDCIVLFDVLHHLSAPAVFFSEAERVLKAGGRIVMMEPYVSWASFFVYKFLHQEGLVWGVDPLETRAPERGRNPFQGNQAIPTLLFRRRRKEFAGRFSRLKVLREARMDSIVYPLSGGFHNPSLLPSFLYSWAMALEGLMKPFHFLLAFRLFVVVEKEQ